MSLVGVVTTVTSAITGAVVSVVVVVSSVVVVPLSEVVEVVEEPLSLLLLQEMTVKLKRNMEKMMSICLTWFPICGFRRTQYIPSIGLFCKNVGILLGGLSDSWRHLSKHLGRNATNYFMYQWAGDCVFPPPLIIKLFQLLHLNQAGV